MRVFIGVGSNLGDREHYIKQAKSRLVQIPGVYLIQNSVLYETEPVGGPPQGKFLNAVWEIEAEVSPRELLGHLQSIESALGRQRNIRNGPRTIDLDILIYGDQVIHEKDLQIPHPRLAERWFVLKPLWDLAADLIPPVFNKSVCELLDSCRANH